MVCEPAAARRLLSTPTNAGSPVRCSTASTSRSPCAGCLSRRWPLSRPAKHRRPCGSEWSKLDGARPNGKGCSTRSSSPPVSASWPASRRHRAARSSAGPRSAACPRAAFIVRGGWPAPRPTSMARSRSKNTTSWRRSASGSKMSLPDLRTRGRWPPPEGPRVAIVGSRRPSPYGEAVAEQLGLELARVGVVVISGLALGIDAAAHRGALNGGGVTVAVMGTGGDVIYPAGNGVLADAILAAGGALVSQFPDGTAPRRHNFPARNYTMAALSDVVVVVEAAEGSGALITAEAALDLHKEVMAAPGSIFSPLSVGTPPVLPGGPGPVPH